MTREHLRHGVVLALRDTVGGQLVGSWTATTVRGWKRAAQKAWAALDEAVHQVEVLLPGTNAKIVMTTQDLSGAREYGLLPLGQGQESTP